MLIEIPIFKDVNTPSPFIEPLAQTINIDRSTLSKEKLQEYERIALDRQKSIPLKPDHIYMDAMGFGMGCCCLQVTFQASSLCEARMLYDQLTPLTPIMMALSAASPAFRGLLSDLDSRWSVIAASVDDRTVGEYTGIDPETKQSTRKIAKSRFDSIDLYICSQNAGFNDIPVEYDHRYYQELMEAGVDPLLSKHISHLFIRDPLVVFKEKLHIDDEVESDHFEVQFS